MRARWRLKLRPVRYEAENKLGTVMVQIGSLRRTPRWIVAVNGVIKARAETAREAKRIGKQYLEGIL